METRKLRKRIIVTSTLVFSSIMAFAQKATDDFSGKWKTADGKIVIITKAGTGFNGTTESKNIVVLKDVTFTDGKWKGSIIKPNDGSAANCELTIDGNNLAIVAKKGMFSKKIVWTKQQ